MNDLAVIGFQLDASGVLRGVNDGVAALQKLDAKSTETGEKLKTIGTGASKGLTDVKTSADGATTSLGTTATATQTATAAVGNLRSSSAALATTTGTATATQGAYTESVKTSTQALKDHRSATERFKDGLTDINNHVPKAAVNVAKLATEIAAFATGMGLIVTPLILIGSHFGALGTLTAVAASAFIMFAPAAAALRLQITAVADAIGLTALRQAILAGGAAVARTAFVGMGAAAGTAAAGIGALAIALAPLIVVLGALYVAWKAVHSVWDVAQEGRAKLLELRGGEDELSNSTAALSQAWKELKEAFGVSAATLGDALVPLIKVATELVRDMIPYMTSLANGFTAVAKAAMWMAEQIGAGVKMLKDFVSNIPDWMKSGAGAIALGPGGLALKGLTSGSGTTTTNSLINPDAGSSESLKNLKPFGDPNYRGRDELYGGWKENDSFPGRGVMPEKEKSKGGGGGESNFITETDQAAIEEFNREWGSLVDQMNKGNVSAKEYERRLEDMRTKLAGKLYDPAMFSDYIGAVRAAEMERQRMFKDTNERIKDNTATTYESMMSGLRKAFDVEKSQAQQIEGLWKNIGNSIEHSFNSFFDSIIDGTKTFSQALRSLLHDLLADLAKQFAKFAVQQMLGSLLGGASGGSGGIGSMIFGLLGGGGGMFFHEGGVVGQGGRFGAVPAGTFTSSTPRFHAGLASDEFPAILQKGETVIPKGGGAGGAGNIAINLTVNNNGGGDDTQTRVQAALIKQLPGFVKGVIANEQRHGGMLSSRIMQRAR